MIDLDGVTHNKILQELAEYVAVKTENDNIAFVKIMILYYLGVIAGNMRVNVNTQDRGLIPVNIYALALAPSGFGKGRTASLIEEIISGFRSNFCDFVFKDISEVKIAEIIATRASLSSQEPSEVEAEVRKEFNSTGAFPFTFSEGTSAALKQIRHKLLMAEIGSINYMVDEIGLNLSDSSELLTVFLELFDRGMVKPKITKNTSENTRVEDIHGSTPANMLLFGVPSRLFDGDKTENLFYSFLDTGYARRCFFGLSNKISRTSHQLTPEEIFKQQTSTANAQMVQKYMDLFTSLADPSYYGAEIYVPDDVSIKLIEYRIACEKFADSLPEHAEIPKAEANHRYFKALKAAGLFAFLGKRTTMSMDDLMEAILLTEESAISFEEILKREKPHVRLAKYIANSGMESTHSDLKEELPFYPTGQARRNEIILLACSWAYKNSIIIRNRFENGIELFSGEALEKTDISKVMVSCSTHYSDNYNVFEQDFFDLHKMTQKTGFHWATHAFTNKHRNENNAIPGFNLIALDVDGTAKLDQVKEILKEYAYLIYTTKSHSATEDRFRIIMPMNYRLKLDSDDYKEFMRNIIDWLPFSIDTATIQRSRKWESFNGQYFYNKGEMVDVLPLIPNTSKNEQYKNESKEVASLPNLERWFAREMTPGNRNNAMLRYALILVDSGKSYIEVETEVLNFNKKISNPLTRDELNSTVLKTVASKLSGV